MIMAKRAVLVIRLENDDLAPVIAQFMSLAIDIGRGEIWRRLADLSSGESASNEVEDAQKCNRMFHNVL